MATSFLYGMFGVSAAFAVFCLSYFLTSRPCNRIGLLTTGQYAICNASSSTGSVAVSTNATDGVYSFHFREMPKVLAGSGVSVLQNTTTKLPSAGFAAMSFSMLPGSYLAYNISAGIESYFYITDSKGYFNLRFGRDYKAFLDAESKPKLNFTGMFERGENETGTTVYFVVSNPEIKERTVNWTFEGVLTQYDMSTAVEVCSDKEDCVFDDISPSSIIITILNASRKVGGRTVDSAVELSQATYYHATTQAGWAVGGVLVFVVVLLFFIPGLHKLNQAARQTRREERALAKKKLEEDELIS